MKRLVLIRHGESTRNQENRFTGWTDIDLTEKGQQEAIKAGQTLKKEGFFFKKAFTSYLKRAVKTLNTVLDQMDLDRIPVEKSRRLNEKHYGTLQGLNKAETAEKYWEEQVLLWRRSYDIATDPLDPQDPRSPLLDPRYALINPADLPLTESLKDCIARTLPYLEETILPTLKQEWEILVAAHGNSLRGVIKILKNLSEEEILKFNLPTAVPYVFEFDDEMNLLKDYFLGDPEEIAALMQAVANQWKKA